MKKCIIIPDSFKGTMSALEFCQIAEKTVKRHMPGCEVLTIPVADGGEGTVDCFVCALGAEKIERSVCGPWQENVSAAYCVKDGTAFIEMAQAAGLPMVGEHKNPAKTTTFGVGSLIRDAVEQGCKNIVIGLGGSCTNDAGAGAAAALGTKFYNEKGESFVPTGDTLEQIVSYDTAETERLLSGCTVTAMCDIDNPLYGETGAAYIFAPQKGANDACVQRLDAGLRHLAAVLHAQLGAEVDTLPGGGAAGGFGAGCAALLCGALRSGITTVLDTVDFDRRAVGCDLVVTGEGSFDAQSLGGKAISGVAGRCQKLRVPAAVLAGRVALTPEQWAPLDLRAVRSINPTGATLEDARANAAAYYRTALETLLKEWK